MFSKFIINTQVLSALNCVQKYEKQSVLLSVKIIWRAIET